MLLIINPVYVCVRYERQCTIIKSDGQVQMSTTRIAVMDTNDNGFYIIITKDMKKTAYFSTALYIIARL